MPTFDSEPPPMAPQDSGMTIRQNRNSQIPEMHEAPAPPGYQPKPYSMPEVPMRNVPAYSNAPPQFTPAPYPPPQQQQMYGNMHHPQMHAQPTYMPPPGPPPSYNSAPAYVQQAPPPPPAPDAPPPPGPPPPPAPSSYDMHDESAPMSGLAAALSKENDKIVLKYFF